MIAALALAACATSLAEPTPLIPRSVLFAAAERRDPQLSPDGKYIAWLAPDKNGVANVWTYDTKTKKIAQVTSFSDFDVVYSPHVFCSAFNDASGR